jgi:hypothetical protein
LNGWKGFVSLDAGVGLGFLGRDKYGTQDFGGHVQLVLTTALQIRPIAHAFTGFRFQHFSDAGVYGSQSLGIDLYLIEVGYRF